MGAGKIVDEAEVLKWFREGRTYAWMVSEYMRKYRVKIGPTAFGNFRERHNLERRNTRDTKLIPWRVKECHRYAWPIIMLRAEASRRAGRQLSEKRSHEVDAWIAHMEEEGSVLHYEPESDKGWHYVARREGVDLDLIREPDCP